MARPRKILDDDRIIQLMLAGKTIKEISQALGCGLATAHKRMRELTGRVQAAQASRRKEVLEARKNATPDVLPDLENIPDGATLAEIDKWLRVAEDEAAVAASEGDVDNHVKWVRLATSLLEAKRKAQPIPKQDPNEHPDMVEAAKRVRERWHKLADSLVRVSKSPIAETIAKIIRPADEQDH